MGEGRNVVTLAELEVALAEQPKLAQRPKVIDRPKPPPAVNRRERARVQRITRKLSRPGATPFLLASVQGRV